VHLTSDDVLALLFHGKMSFLSSALSPIKDIINGLQAPIQEVERIFGAAISITEAIIQQLVALLKQLDSLFDGAVFADIFITPFKNAVLLAVDGLDDLTTLIFQYGQEGFTDITDTLETPIKDTYALFRKGVADLSKAYTDIMNDLTPEPSRILDSSLRDVHSFLDRIENDIALIKNDILVIFQVTHAKASDIEQEFVGFAKAGVTTLTTDVNRVGQIAIGDASAFLTSAQNRTKNESGAIDTFIALMIGIILIGIVGLLIVTRSVSLLVASVLVLGTILVTIFFL